MRNVGASTAHWQAALRGTAQVADRKRRRPPAESRPAELRTVRPVVARAQHEQRTWSAGAVRGRWSAEDVAIRGLLAPPTLTRPAVTPVACSGSSIAAELADLTRSHVETYNYDGFTPVIEFLDHADAVRERRPQASL